MSPNYDKDWHGALNRIKQTLETTEESHYSAKLTINAFRQGSPPRDGIKDVTVGLQSSKTIFERELMRTRDGACAFTLVNGHYGTGKSHALYLLREIAIERNFLVSFITLSQRECPMSDLGRVYSHIMHRIEGKKCDDLSTFQDILDIWAGNMRKLGEKSLYRTQQLIRSLHPDFQQALAKYLCPGDTETSELAERWLIGDDIAKTTATRLGVKLRATNDQALVMLKQLGNLIRAIGFAGFVILLDEAEAIPSYAGSSKQKLCYDNLCRLLDRNNRIPHCYFVYATTPMFFHKSHSHTNISQNSCEVHNLLPLTHSEYLRLGTIIRNLYQISDGWKGPYASFDDRQVKISVEWYLGRFPNNGKPRDFVRTLVSALDICASNPNKKLSQIFCHEEIK